MIIDLERFFSDETRFAGRATDAGSQEIVKPLEASIEAPLQCPGEAHSMMNLPEADPIIKGVQRVARPGNLGDVFVK